MSKDLDVSVCMAKTYDLPKFVYALLDEMHQKIKHLERNEAVCHCGSLISEHTVNDGHAPVEMRAECKFERLLDRSVATLIAYPVGQDDGSWLLRKQRVIDDYKQCLADN